MASFKSFLSAIGHGFEDVFKWLGSSQGQAAIASGESLAVTIGGLINPAVGVAIGGIEQLINAGLKQVLAMEASAAAVGAQSGTGAQKAAAVVASLTPQIGAFLISVGVSSPTSEQVQTIATTVTNSIVSILNSIPPPTTPAA